MEFERIVWGGTREYRTVIRKKLGRYCGMEWNDAARDMAVKRGQWFPEKEVERPESVGFHLPAWYSPFVSLSDVAADFLKALHDPQKMMTFVTQRKAEPWKEAMTSKDEDLVLALKCGYAPGVVPKDAVALTCGIDVQKHGFYFVVRAWAPDLTSWLIQYGQLSSWDDVETQLFKVRYEKEDSEETLGIWRAAMDTGGGKNSDDDWSRTEEVYHWLRNNSRGVVFGIKGASRPQLNRVQVRVIDKMARGNRPIPGGLELRFLDTIQFKGLIHWRMERKEDESQRFNLHRDTGMDFARQILAEERRKDRRGNVYWKQVRKDNHYLDCEIYAAACADPEWAPSLTFLAKGMAEETEKKSSKNSLKSQNIQTRKRPEWYDRR